MSGDDMAPDPWPDEPGEDDLWPEDVLTEDEWQRGWFDRQVIVGQLTWADRSSVSEVFGGTAP